MDEGSESVQGESRSFLALIHELRSRLAVSLGVAPSDVPLDCPFREMGVSSFIALQYLQELGEIYGNLSKTLLFECHTLPELANYLCRERASQVHSRHSVKPLCQLVPHAQHRPDQPWYRRIEDLANGFIPRPCTAALDWLAPWLFFDDQHQGFFRVGRTAQALVAFSYIGEPGDFESLAERFLDFAQEQGLHGDVIAAWNGSARISATPMAQAAEITDLADFPARSPIGHIDLNHPSAQGLETHELRLSPDHPLLSQLRHMVDAWEAPSVDASLRALMAQLEQARMSSGHHLLLTTRSGKPVALTYLSDQGQRARLLEKGILAQDAMANSALPVFHQVVQHLLKQGVAYLALSPLPYFPAELPPLADPELVAQISELNDLGLWVQEAALQFSTMVATRCETLNICRLRDRPGSSLEDLLTAANPPQLARPTQPARSSDRIAVIGMAGRYPLANTLEAFWDNIITGRDCIRPFPTDRRGDYPDPGLPFSDAEVGGYLDQVDRFDALFFNISPREAALIDPHERLFLEIAWTALEHAGYAPETLPERTGVYVGAVWSHYQILGHELVKQGTLIAPNSFLWSIANRVSTVLDVHGPSMAVDTACSASHTAIHLARQSLLCGESELAIAGGVSLDLHPLKRRIAEVGRALSRDGRCRAFGAGANGYVAGEGAGAIVLKRLERAEADGDTIHGVILASTINHGGNASGYTVPNPKAQAALIRGALEAAGLRGQDIDTIEAHGTGTELGDPIEVRGLTLAFGSCPAQVVGLGSVKSNIGHLEPAAGIAGLTKVLLQFRHQQLAPTLHVAELNPHIDLAETPFRIQRQAAPWPSGAKPRRAGISAFGAGGGNAHIILEDYSERSTISNDELELFPFSARNAERLTLLITEFLEFLDRTPPRDTRAMAFTLQVGRRPHKFRLAVLAKGVAELRDKLSHWLQGTSSPGCFGNQGKLAEGLTRAELAKTLEERAQDWVAGRLAACLNLQPERPGRRIPLPTYPFEQVRHWLPQAAATATTRPGTERVHLQAPPDSAALLFEPGWREQAPAPPAKPQAILLFDLDRSTADAFEARLGLRPLLVRPGQSYAYDPREGFVLDPDESDHYQRLARTLEDELGLPGHALFLWSLRQTDEHLEARLNAGLRPLFLLSRCLRVRRDNPLQMLIACTDTHPEDRALAAFARTATLEQPGLQLRLCSLTAGPTPPDALVAIALEEWSSNAVEVQRGPRRAIRDWRELPAQQPTLPPLDQGACLITGGLGGIGLIFAQALAKQRGARLVLSGRSAANPRSAAELARLEAAGAQVLYVQADITQAADVDRLIETARQRFGAIGGIIHSAGLLHDALIHKKRRVDFEQVLAPKVAGTRLLDQATAREPLAFFALCSSVASIFGNAGQCDYAYANRFMDEFAAERQRRVARGERHGHTVSINWPLWAEGGMGVDEAHEKWMARTLGMYAMPTDVGVAALAQAIAAKAAQVAVFYGEPARIRPHLEPAASIAHVGAEQSPVVDSGQLDHLRPRLEQSLVALMAELMKIAPDEIETSDQVFDIGFDSLTLAELANAANERYDLDLMPTLFYEFMSARDLAGYLLTEYAEKLQRHFGAQAQPAASTSTLRAPEPLRTPTPTPLATPAVPLGEREPIAIIGIGGCFPGSPDIERLWHNLEHGADLISEVPPSRWNWQDHYGDPAEPGNRMRSRWGSFLEEVDMFDSLYFGIPPREAALMDPQHRVFIETTWATLENAAYAPQSLAGSRTGVFVGIATLDYAEYLQQLGVEADGYLATGNSHCMLPNRISFLLDLHGPSETVDTACSSSLLAIHRAIESLRSGDCELALAGAVNVLLNPIVQVSFDKAGLLSPDGRCRSFDKDASGYARGEGSGAVLLKPLGRARQDGDFIHGLVLGSAIRHAGRSSALTAPNPAGQVQLIVDAWRAAGVSPVTATYLEAHGSGTEMGDSIEFNSSTRAFAELIRHYGQPRPNGPWCGIGSVRSNLGHLDTVTGMAALFKVLLGMQRETLPGTVHFRQENPFLRLAESPFQVVAATRPWTRLSDPTGQPIPLRAGINSFSFGGLNAHLVVEEYPETAAVHDPRPQLIVLSARNEERLRAYAAKLGNFLAAQPGLALDRIAYSLQLGRDPLAQRLALVVDNVAELARSLAEFGAGAAPDGIQLGQVGKKKSDTAKLFEGTSGAVFLHEIVAARDLARLAFLFVQGVEIPWSQLYHQPAPRRLPLPTYPFARVRHWVDAPPGFVWGQSAVQTPAIQVIQSQPAPVPSAPSAASVSAASPREAIVQLIVAMLAEFLHMSPSEIDLEADLGDYGLNSFTGGRLALQLRDRLAFDLPISALYEYPNIEEFVDFLLDHVDPERLMAPSTPTPALPETTAIDKLEFSPSDAQRALWFIHQMDPSTTAWHLPMVLALHDPFDEEVLERALQFVAARHQAPRTRFTREDKALVQRVDLPLPSLQRGELTGLDPTALHDRLADLAFAPFALDEALFRTFLLRGDHHHYLLIVTHHIIMDGSSFAILLNELLVTYSALRRGALPQLHPAVPFSDFVTYQHERLEGATGQQLRDWWLHQLGDGVPALNLPHDGHRGATEIRIHQTVLSGELTAAGRHLASQRRASLFMVLIAAFKLLLARYTGQDDFAVGTPFANRNELRFQEVLGYFINMLPIRARLSRRESSLSAIDRVKKAVLGALDHGEYPFSRMVEALDLGRETFPLFQVCMVYQSEVGDVDQDVFGLGEQKHDPDKLNLKLEHIVHEKGGFDLTFEVFEFPDHCDLFFKYNAAVYSDQRIEALARHFEVLLAAMAAEPNKPAGYLNFVASEECLALLQAEPADVISNQRPIHLLIAEQAQRSPEAIAVVAEGVTLSYRDLDQRANQVAWRLRQLGAGPERFVALCLDRGADLAVGLLGILKAGACYVPIDPNYPEERRALMLEEAQAAVLLTQRAHAARFATCGARVLALDSQWGLFAREPKHDPAVAVQPEHAAYLIFTSGSTGRPKGVPISHRALAHYAQAFADCYQLSADDRVLQFASISFDTAVEEIFPTWMRGACLVFRPPQPSIEPIELMHLCSAHGITLLDLPTAYWHLWLNEIEDTLAKMPPRLRLVIVGGEQVAQHRLAQWAERVGDRVAWTNTYGPTEATIAVTHYELAELV